MNQTVLSASDLLQSLRASGPLIHHITNYVTVNDCANTALAIGASPIMADAIEEAADIAAISSALVLNMGTLNQRTVSSMLAAGKKANETGIPVVFDPVGAGASRLRGDTAAAILEQVKCSVIRGNMSEIRYLAGLGASAKGVDASRADLSDSLESGLETAKILAKKYRCVSAITGKTDILSDGLRTFRVENGHEMLGVITGTGCMCTTLVGAYCGVSSDFLLAAAAGILSMGIAGEIAFERAGQRGPGSFRIALTDALGNMSPEILRQRAKLYE